MNDDPHVVKDPSSSIPITPPPPMQSPFVMGVGMIILKQEGLPPELVLPEGQVLLVVHVPGLGWTSKIIPEPQL
jgi:hypothetical protein